MGSRINNIGDGHSVRVPRWDRGFLSRYVMLPISKFELLVTSLQKRKTHLSARRHGNPISQGGVRLAPGSPLLACSQSIDSIPSLLIMSAAATPSTSAASSESRFQAIFQDALKSYQKQTKKDLLTHPLASQLQSCDSTTAILAILQDQVREFEKTSDSDERLTKWLRPTVNVLNAFSAAVSGGVSLVSLAY